MAKTGTQLANQMLHKSLHSGVYGGPNGMSVVFFNDTPHNVVRNKGYNSEFDEDNLVLDDTKGNFKEVGSRQLWSDFRNRPDESLEQLRERLGRSTTNDEYRDWIRPKIAASYKEFTDSGYDRDHIRSELMDAYGYEDLVNEAMGGSADDDWFNVMKTKTKFPKGVFVPEIDTWDKLRDELTYLTPQEKYAFLRAVAKNHTGR